VSEKRKGDGADNLALTEDEKQALIALLKRTLGGDHFPYAPRLDPLKAILVKLEPPVPQPALPPLKHYEPPRAIRGRRRR
jgi:hypothetical protein